MILPQHQPHMPGEMPCAYLYRCGDPTAADYEHYQEMHDALVVDHAGVFDRRRQEMRMYGSRRRWCATVQVGKTDEQVENAQVFFVWHADESQPEILAVFSPATWENITALVDLEELAESIEEPDYEAERRDEEADVKMRQQRENE